MATTLKYETIDGLDVHLEYIIPESATKENKAPIYLWFVRLNALLLKSLARGVDVTSPSC
jgi:hypothetical protein